jgi:hypothetical protein
MSDHFFAIQLAVPAPPHDPWRRRLAELVGRHLRDLSLADKRGLWGGIGNLLLEVVDRCPLGYWDFQADGRSQFDEWQQGIEDDALQPWVPDASGEPMDHVLVSALFLIPSRTATARFVAEQCDLDEQVWRTRLTYRRLVEVLAQISFPHVRSDAIYLTPGGDRHAFSLRELLGAGYEYLAPIE